MQALKRSSKKKYYVAGIGASLVLLGVAGWFGYSSFSTKKEIKSISKPASQKPTIVKKQETIRLIASGDELPHDSINAQAKTASGYDYTPFYTEVKPVFDKADVRFCNQEVPSAISAGGTPTGYPVFNAPTQFATDLTKVGCNVINVATNHTNDKLQTGIDATLTHWDTLQKFAIAGANRSTEEQNTIRYFTVKGVKFAFLAYNYESNNKNLTSYGVNMFDEGLMSRQLAEAKQQGAVTLVSVHWGTEDSSDIDAAQQRWSTFLADNGADIVIGTGPHVIEPVKKLPKKGGGETLVWYSLGNMLSTQLKVEELIGGFAVMDFKIVNNKAELSAISFLPTYMHYEWTPRQKAAQDLLARKNIKIYLLDKAAEPLALSQNGTTVEEQTKRVSDLLNQYTPVKIIKSNEY